MIELIPSKLTHVGPLTANMREIDKLECWAMGRTPKDGLRLGLRTSHLCWTAMLDGRPIAMMGVSAASMISGEGIVWMLGTEDIYRQGRALLKLGPMVFARMLQDFQVIENVVSTRNKRAIRLLVRWGFSVGGEIQVHRGVNFIPFRMSRGPSIQGTGPSG